MAGPDQWGPHGWKFIHYVTMGYPDKPTKNDMIKYKNFLESIGDVLPCIICANHYKNHLIEHPIDKSVLQNKRTLMAWAVKVHNIVNENNGKKVYSLNEALRKIHKDNDTCKIENFAEVKSSNSILYWAPIIIFGIILLLQIYKIRNNTSYIN